MLSRSNILVLVAAFALFVYVRAQGSSCFDAHPNCGAWANNGFCTNTFYTLQFRGSICAVTCNLCDKYTCTDRSEKCGSWADNFFCNTTVYSTHTKQLFCAKTCGFCVSPVTTAPGK